MSISCETDIKLTLQDKLKVFSGPGHGLVPSGCMPLPVPVRILFWASIWHHEGPMSSISWKLAESNGCSFLLSVMLIAAFWKSTSVCFQVTVWCHQAACLYLYQWGSCSGLPFGIMRDQWVQYHENLLNRMDVHFCLVSCWLLHSENSQVYVSEMLLSSDVYEFIATRFAPCFTINNHPHVYQTRGS